MKVEGSYSFNADLEKVWSSLLSPEVLSECIPGCERFEQTGQNTYDVSVKAKVSAISGAYKGVVAVSEIKELESYKMAVEGGGSVGTIKGEAVLRFTRDGDATWVHLEGDGQVTGIVARVGQRLLGSASNMLMNQFFSCLKEKVES